jgi:hypothetical protein
MAARIAERRKVNELAEAVLVERVNAPARIELPPRLQTRLHQSGASAKT